MLAAIEETVVVPATGKYHKRYFIDGRTVDDGRCGADDNWKVVDSIPEDIEPAQLCGFCWPHLERENP